MAFEDETPVWPDGLGIRRRRRALGLSRADLVATIERRSREATGRSETVPRNLLEHVEERGERLPYGTLSLIALGLDCNPVELLGDGAGEPPLGARS